MLRCIFLSKMADSFIGSWISKFLILPFDLSLKLVFKLQCAQSGKISRIAFFLDLSFQEMCFKFCLIFSHLLQLEFLLFSLKNFWL